MIFDLTPSFHVDAGETLYIYKLFNNFDEKNTDSGDDWITLLHTTDRSMARNPIIRSHASFFK